MFGLGANEIFLILLFGFLIFGPDKLPKIAKTVGQALNKFRDAQNEMNNVIKDEVYNPDEKSSSTKSEHTSSKNPLDALSELGDDDTSATKGESFTERKARYDRERALRRAKEKNKVDEKEAAERRKQAAKSAAAASAAARRAMKQDSEEREQRATSHISRSSSSAASTDKKVASSSAHTTTTKKGE